jgi:hypothetical protein
MSAVAPPPVGPDWKVWARQLSAFLSRSLVRLQFKTQNDTAAEDGVMLWDGVSGYPVVSKNGVWRQIVLEDGHYNGGIAANQSAASANTAYALTYTAGTASGITNGSPSSRIVFDEGGEYMVSFSAQISSSSGSTVDFWFWPRVNGANVAGSTMKNALHNSGAVLVVSRSAVFNFNAGDYLEAMWAVSNTSGFLNASAATAFAPAAPASTIAITRLHG